MSFIKESTSEFLEKGFLLVEGGVPEDLLARWRQIAEEMERLSLEAHANGEHIHGACVIEDPVGPRLMRYDDIFVKYHDDLIELLSCDAMQQIMKYFSGPTSVVVQTDLLFKHQHPHPVIRWHQGAPHSREYPYLNVGIYLDDADFDDGCLHYVPGTQHELHDIESIEINHGWEPPGAVQQPAKAGDILVQDMMILHASKPKRSPGARRTVYVEIRPYEALSKEEGFSQEWSDTRKAWTGEILKGSNSDVYDQDELAYFEHNYDHRNELIKAMQAHFCPPIPAVYSVFINKGPDYPVPEDLL